MEITSILGETRPILKTWPDGSHECPFCGYPACPACENPACPASVHATAANRRWFEAAAAAEALLREAEARRRNYEIAVLRISREQAELGERRADWYAWVSACGACHRCSNMYSERIVRHREKCPKEHG